jgi:myo-inositol-1(or 4)-monophosphatase
MHPHLNIAISAARRAGTIITRHFEQPEKLNIYEKGLNDLVTTADRAAENAIIDTILKAYPHHSILGEESGAHPGNECVWVIDPIDGTMNFVHDFPQFAVSIAIKQKGYLEHGVIYDPINQNLYTASKGAGAQLNNRRIRISNREDLKGALIGTDYPSCYQYFSKHTAQNETENTIEILCKGGCDLRKIGCASLNLAYVASGKLDGYWESGLKEWDIAAGVLMVREAGGFVSDFNGQNDFLASGNIIAGTRKIHAELLDIIRNSHTR